MTTKKSAKKDEKNNRAIFKRFYSYDLTGGGPPWGHTHEDAAELTFKSGAEVWRVRDKARELQNFVEKHGKPVSERESVPYSENYASSSYQQIYLLPKRFTKRVISELIPA